MPTPKEKETRKEYVSRCIPYVIREGTAKNPEQAAAMCHGMFTESKKADEYGLVMNHFELLQKVKNLRAMKDDVCSHFDKKGEFKDYDACLEHMSVCEEMSEETAKSVTDELFGGIGIPIGFENGIPPYYQTATENEVLKEFSEKSYRARQTDPGQYKQFRYAKDEFGSGISAVYGIKTEEGKRKAELQSIVFDDKKFTKSEAVSWLKSHDHKTGIEATGEAKTKKEIMEESLAVDREHDVATLAGAYEPPPTEPLPPKISDPMSLESTELTPTTRPASFVGERNPKGTLEDVQIPGKKTWGLEEVELPDALKPKKFGEVPLDDSIKLKQP